MSKRLLLALALATTLVLTPFAASADDMPVAEDSPVTSPFATPAPNANSGLGPSATAPAGGSNADVGTLQPAGGNPLQSTTQDSSGLTAPNQQTLQNPASSDEALKVLAGETEGRTNPNEESSWTWLWYMLGLGVLTVAFYLLLKRYPHVFARQKPASIFAPNASLEPQPVTKQELTQTSESDSTDPNETHLEQTSDQTSEPTPDPNPKPNPAAVPPAATTSRPSSKAHRKHKRHKRR